MNTYRRLLFVVVLGLPVWCLAAPFEAIELDRPATLSLRDLEDRLHTLKDYRGKVVLINFWATWCTPCIKELPEISHLQKQLSERPFVVLTINVGERKSRVRQFVKGIDMDLPVLLDNDSRSFYQWGGQVLPTNLLFDANGRLRFQALGDPGWDYLPTLDIIEQLLNETDAKTSLTLGPAGTTLGH